jgi:hypothetical protein
MAIIVRKALGRFGSMVNPAGGEDREEEEIEVVEIKVSIKANP